MQQKDKYLTDEQVAHGFSWEPYVEDVIILMFGGREIVDRSVTHATNTLTVLNNYHVGFRSLMDTSIDTTTPNGILVFNILASVAQFEKDIDAQRIREGVKYAQEHGTKSGKPIAGKEPR